MQNTLLRAGRRALASLLLLPLLISGCATTGGGSDEGARLVPSTVFPSPYHVRELPNGLRVVVMPTSTPDIVSIQIAVQTGSRNEAEPGKSGFAHFFEHMMFRGSENYDADRYNAIMKNIGADQNAYTTDDYTNYHITFTRGDLETVMKLEADRFLRLRFTEPEFRTEALAVKGEYLKNFADPQSKLFERLRDTAFTRHTYKHTTMGFFEDIEAMPDQFQYALEFYRRWYRPENTTIVLAGDVEPAEVFELAERYWSDWEPVRFSLEIPAEPEPRGPVYDHVAWDSPAQPWLVVAFHGPAFRPEGKELPALQAIGRIHFSHDSPLYQELVVERKLADRIAYSAPPRKDPYLISVWARLTDEANAPAVRDAIIETLVKARVEKVEAQRLEDVKSSTKYGLLASLESAEEIGALLARSVQYDRRPEVLDETLATLDALTPDDLQAAAERWFTDRGRVTVTLSHQPMPEAIREEPQMERRTQALRARLGKGRWKVLEMPSDSPLVNLHLVFRTGAAFEPDGRRGVAGLTTAMLAAGGSALHTRADLAKALKPTGGSFWSQVDKETIAFGGTVHRDQLDRWYAIVSEHLFQPGWREEDLEHFRIQAINAIRSDLRTNNEEELGKEVLYQGIYPPDHPYHTLNRGVVGDIERLSMEDLKRFHARQFTQDRLILGIAGDYPREFLERVQSDLASLPAAGEANPAIPAPPAIGGHRAIIVRKETRSTAVSFGFPIEVNRGHPDWVALWLARSWLGEHRSFAGHLFQVIREQRGMNYGDYAYIEYFPNGMFQFHPDNHLIRSRQIFQVWLRPLRSINDAHFATRAAMYELQRLIDEGLSQEEFEATRNYLYRFVAILAASQDRQLGYAIDSDAYGIAPFVEYVRKGLERLTVEEVNRVIRRHLQTDDILYVFVTGEAEALRDRLAADTPSPLRYNSPKPEALLEEDRIIERLPLGLPAGRIRIVDVETLFE